MEVELLKSLITTELGVIISSIVVINIALVGALKELGLVKRFLPLMSIVSSIVLVGIFSGTSNFLTILAGVIIGTSSSGSYDFVKYTIQGKQ